MQVILEYAGLISGILLPVVGWMVRALLTARHDLEDGLQSVRLGVQATRDDLAAYKLQVAKEYASVSYLKDVENRLIVHLERIEDKLDRRPVNV